MSTETTAVKWADLTPRERDALVAEKVLGLEVTKYAMGGGGEPCVLRPRHDEPGAYYEAALKQYSRAVAAAWEVVEKMQASDDDTFFDFVTQANNIGARPLLWLYSAEAAQHLCIAALRACGVEVET